MPVRSLFGLPDAEILYDSVAQVWESEIDPYRGLDDVTWEIEEFEAVPPMNHVPSVDSIAEWLAESAADHQGLENSYDPWAAAVSTPVVRRLLSHVRDAVVGNIGLRVAGDRIGVHTITLDASGRPYLNGERIYKTRPRTDEELLAAINADRGISHLHHLWDMEKLLEEREKAIDGWLEHLRGE